MEDSKTLITKRICQGWPLFPNAQTIAYYDALSQTINLNTVERETLSNLHEMENELLKRETYKIICHELRHWSDNISTLWGQKRLINIYNSINARLNNNDKEFWRIKDSWDHFKKDRFSKYYSTLTDDTDIRASRVPWIWQLSVGNRFNEKGFICEELPIIFTRFSTGSNKFVSRVPFSIESLLETSAMYSELEVDLNFIKNLTPKERETEMMKIERQCRNWLYDPQLSPYSVAGHLAANTNAIYNVVSAFKLSSLIATIALNLPEIYFKDIRIPSEFSIWGKRNEKFLQNKDRGYVFVCLLYNIKDQGKQISSVDEILAYSNLPNEQCMNKEIQKEIEKNQHEIIDGQYTPKLLNLLKIGQNLYAKRGLAGKNYSTLDLLNDNEYLPSMIAGDDLIGDNVELDEWIDFIWDIQKKMKEFIEVCDI